MKPFLLALLVIPSIAFSAVSFEEFLTLKSAVSKAFIELRPNSGHSLDINRVNPGMEENFWWNLDDIHASYSGYEDSGKTYHSIFLFGGFARLEGMSLDGLAATACHEIGHGLGGAPYKKSGSTAEGQADYYATNVCLPIVFKYLKQTEKAQLDSFEKSLCQKQSNHTFTVCARLFESLKSDIYFYEHLGDYVTVRDYSTHIQQTLNFEDYYYPESQCRLDTSIHGILGFERPQCWFPGGAVNGLGRSEEKSSQK